MHEVYMVHTCGSANTTLISGFFSFKNIPTPAQIHNMIKSTVQANHHTT